MATMGQGAAALVFDANGRLLLVRHTYDGGRWVPPGGRMEPGEDPLDCVARETLEETGVEVAVEHLVGLYRLENGFAAYAFGCRIVSGEPAVQDPAEIAEIARLAPEALPSPSRTSSTTRSPTLWPASAESFASASPDQLDPGWGLPNVVQ